jgi:uncharacterized membrane protein YtjA (UPF0391 family)
VVFARVRFGNSRLGSSGGPNVALRFDFFIVALIAGIFGFFGIAAAAAGIAKILFFIFLVLFLVSLVSGLMSRA